MSAIEKLLRDNPVQAKAIIYQEIAEKSLYEFIKLFWKELEPGREFREAKHIAAICEHLEAVSAGQIKKLLINIPPGFGKSIICNCFFPAWQWTMKPSLRYLTFSYASSLTERDNGRFKTLVTCDLYKAMWGDKFKLTKDSQIKVENNKAGFKIASSVGGTGTGERGNILICLTSASMIQTDGGLISIGEIVSKKLDVRIAGYDKTGLKWQRIETWQENPFRPLVEIQFDGGSIKCTEGHRIFTQRGYVPASELAKDDNLWSIGGKGMCQLFLGVPSEGISFAEAKLLQPEMSWFESDGGCLEGEQQAVPDMRQNGISTSGASPADAEWFILQPRMQRNKNFGVGKSDVSGRHKEKKMQNLQKGIYAKNEHISTGMLFAKVWRYFTAIAGNKMSFLQKSIQATKSFEHMLFSVVRRLIAFKAYEGHGQWALCSRIGGEAISEGMESGVQKENTRARWQSLPHVQNDTEETRQASLCSSYRLHQGKSGRDKPDNTMPFLPWEASWQQESEKILEKRNIISVKKISEIHECTYNLSVYPCHNFFADGILVKNCDDLNNIKDVESSVTRTETNRWYMEVLPSRVIDPNETATINIQQRSNEDDVSGLILSRDMGYEHLCLSMEFDPLRKCYTSIGWGDWRDEKDELLWPEVYDRHAVDNLKSDKEMSSYAYAGQYQQSPSPRGGGIIKEKWWGLYPEHGEEFDDRGRPTRPLEYPPFDTIICSVDTAYTTAQENDYSACVCLGVYRHDGQPRIMLMAGWQRRLEFHGIVPQRQAGESEATYLDRTEWGLVELVAYTAHKFRAERVLIENKASGISVAQELRRLFSDEKFGVQLVEPKGDKVARAYSVQHLFENGLIFAPERDWSRMVIAETSKFPRGSHDDIVDALVQGLIHLRQVGLIVRKDEFSAEQDEESQYRGGNSAPLYDV